LKTEPLLAGGLRGIRRGVDDIVKWRDNVANTERHSMSTERPSARDPMASAGEIHVYAGTAGHSAWFSEDLGLSWTHPNSHSGMYLEARVWAFSSHPALPGSLHAGT